MKLLLKVIVRIFRLARPRIAGNHINRNPDTDESEKP